MPADFTKVYFERSEAWSERIDRYQQEVLSDLLAILPRDCASLLDVGCGNGLLTNQLPQSIRVVGLDPSRAALETVQREKVCADATQIPFADGSFEVVMANDVIEHVRRADEAAIVREMARVASKLVIVTVPFMEDIACASVRCNSCGNLYHLNHHRRAYDIASTRDLPLGSTWRCAARIVTGDFWSREPAPLPRLKAHAGYGLTQHPTAVCPGCGSAETVVPRQSDRALRELEREIAKGAHAPTREMIEMTRCRTELMTVFAKDLSAEEELWARLENASVSSLKAEPRSLYRCDLTGESSRSVDLPRWPVDPRWVRNETDPGRTLVNFPGLHAGSFGVRIEGEASQRGNIVFSQFTDDYKRVDEVEFLPGKFEAVLPATSHRGEYGRLFEFRAAPGIALNSVTLLGPECTREHRKVPETARFVRLEEAEQIWLSIGRYDGDMPVDSWMAKPSESLRLRKLEGDSKELLGKLESTSEFGTIAGNAVRGRRWRVPVARLARPSGGRMHLVSGRCGRFLMICHDQQIDRRILQQASTLVDAGWTGTIVCLSRDDEDQLESDGAISIHRIGLRHIIPDNWMYWGHAVRNWLCHRNHTYGRYLARINGWTYPPQLRLAYGGKNINHPLSFDICFEEAGRRYPADVVVAHDLPALRAGVALAEHWDVPLVYDAHELYSEQVTFTRRQKWICNTREKHFIGRADVVFTVNQSIAEEMGRRYGIKTPRVLLNAGEQPKLPMPEVGPDPIRSRLNLPKDKRIVLLQGGLSPHRNIETLASAAKHLRASDAVVVILGSGSIESELSEIGRRDGTLGSRLFLLPAVPQDQLIAYSAGADLGVIPYPAVDLNTRFCTPNKLFEYIAAGVPIAANDLPELRRYVKDTGFGEVGNTSTPGELAALIDRMLATPGMLEACRARIAEHGRRFSWDTEGQGYLEAVEYVVRTHQLRSEIRTFEAKSDSRTSTVRSPGGSAL